MKELRAKHELQTSVRIMLHLVPVFEIGKVYYPGQLARVRSDIYLCTRATHDNATTHPLHSTRPGSSPEYWVRLPKGDRHAKVD